MERIIYRSQASLMTLNALVVESVLIIQLVWELLVVYRMTVHQFRVIAATADEAAMKAADKYPGYVIKVWRSLVPMIGGEKWWEVKVISGRDEK